jgi:hypothetical protein
MTGSRVAPPSEQFTPAETERRYAMLADVMRNSNLDAVLLVHHGTSRPSDNLQSYFLQWDYIFGTVVTLFSPEGRRVAFGSELQSLSDAGVLNRLGCSGGRGALGRRRLRPFADR